MYVLYEMLFVLIDCKSYYKKKNIYYSVKDSLYFFVNVYWLYKIYIWIF